MNERIKELAEQAFDKANNGTISDIKIPKEFIEKFAELMVKECIDKIETYHIPVGNSAAGEMACEWTYAALKEIRDEIKQDFGVDRN